MRNTNFPGENKFEVMVEGPLSLLISHTYMFYFLLGTKSHLMVIDVGFILQLEGQHPILHGIGQLQPVILSL